MIVKVIGAFVAIYAFSIILEVPKKYLLYAGGTGAVGWFVYLLCEGGGMNVVMANFLAAMAAAMLSQSMARLFKAPVTVFLIGGILPMVPGAGMYRIVFYMLEGNTARVSYYFIQTLQIAGVIAVAIFLVDTLFRLLTFHLFIKKA